MANVVWLWDARNLAWQRNANTGRAHYAWVAHPVAGQCPPERGEASPAIGSTVGTPALDRRVSKR
jgi:hypothetical protein